MNDKERAWTLLTELVGTYKGQGINHENQSYTGNFKLEFAFENKVLLLSATATGKNGEIYHNEHTWIGKDIAGTLTLYVSSNNHPGVTHHCFQRIEAGSEGQKTIVFRFGDIENGNSFREEISISLFKNQSVEHTYAWGLPAGDFQKRSVSRMERV